MQDRSRQLDENLLQRTAGPYIATHGRTIHWVKVGSLGRLNGMSVLPPQLQTSSENPGTSVSCRFCCESRLLPIDAVSIRVRATGFDLPALTPITQLQRYAAHRAIVGGGRVTSEANRRRF